MAQSQLPKVIEHLGRALDRIMGMNPYRGVDMIKLRCDIYGFPGGCPVNPDHHHSQDPVPVGTVQNAGPVIIVALIVNMAMGVKKNHMHSYGVFSSYIYQSAPDICSKILPGIKILSLH